MKLSTPIEIGRPNWQLCHDDPVLLLGSCFTDEVGDRLARSGFDVLCNPFGTLYNPLSIAACWERVQSGVPFSHDCLVEHEGLFHSWLHHGSFSRSGAQEVLDACNAALEKTCRFVERNPVLIITLGTAYAFFLNDPDSPMNGQVVANCHKLNARYFERRRLSVDEVVVACRPWTKLGRALFTVSPIRHLADGLHGNQLSKATLLLALEQLGCDYFPSYEILLDELRDYRFYARDLCHPSDVAVDIVYERFQQTYMSEPTRQNCRECEKHYRQSQHRQIHNI